MTDVRGSTAYVDPDTLLLEHARRRAHKVFVICPDDGGRITFGERDVFDSSVRLNLSPDKRNIGMVFQSYALWPHMTVRKNIGYPLRARKLKGPGTRSWVEETAALLARRKRNVQIRFAGAPPRLDLVPGVSAIESNGGGVRCRVEGDMRPFLAAIADAGVEDLTIEPARLEDAFLELYEGGQQ